MKLTIRSRHVLLTPALRDLIQRRLELAFSRIALEIRSVHCTITDINGPRGGPDKQVRLRVRARSLGGLVVEHLGSDPLVTVSLAADRAERALLRSLARRRSFAPFALAT